MIAFQIAMIVFVMLTTFGLALPWIISNNQLPLIFNMAIFVSILGVYVFCAQLYIKRLNKYIKKARKDMKVTHLN